MAAIKDVVVSVSSATATSSRVAFGIPVMLGYTGQRSILLKGSGASGIVYKSTVRNDTGITVAVEVGASFAYAAVGKDVTITIPSVSTTVRELIADFNANAPTLVTDLISLARTSTGSGAVTVHTAEPLAYTEFRDIRDISQLDYYYDSTDLEYVAVGNYLQSRPTPGRLYLYDVFSSVDIPGDLALYDDGSWWLVLALTTDSAKLLELSDYVNIRDRMLLAVSSDVNILDTVQGVHTVFVIHDAPDDHPEVSWAAYKLPAQPGSTTWKFAGPLFGQTANETATLSDLLDVRANRGNSYVTDNGLTYVDGGRVNYPSETTYIDQIRSRAWISINVEADILETLVRASQRNSKIPYTDQGIQQILGVIERRLSLAGDFGIIAPVETTEQAEASSDGRYRFSVTAPTRGEIEINVPGDIIARVLNSVEFQYVEAGAIEEVTVTGRVILTE